MLGRLLMIILALMVVTATVNAQNLKGLPSYTADKKLSGVIRNFGSDLSGIVKVWEEGFRKYQPDIRFDDNFPSSDGANAGLISGVADVGTSGREPVLTEFLSFNETFKYDLEIIAVATGAYDLKGKTWAVVIFVNKDNPLTRLTMKQLDGIFGAERTGGYVGYKWFPQFARSAKDDIRTWGRLGLTGEWANQPIHTYGYAYTGMTNFFQLKVFNGGEKWNPNYREYVESETKMVTEESGSSYHMLGELSKDKYGIAWSGIPHAKNFPDVKPLALAAADAGPYVAPSRESVMNRTYPLTRSIFMYIKHKPGHPVDPNVREFLRFILSREGQALVAEHKVYLPLTAEAASAEWKKVE